VGRTAAPHEVTNAATVLSGIGDPNAADNRATISTGIRIRTTCDLDGDGLDEIVTGAGPSGGPHVRVFSLAGGVVREIAGFFAYDPAFPGGVNVACGDVTGDGVPEIITGAGPGGGPHVRAFSLAGGVVTEVASFYAYDPAFPGGVTVAAAARPRDEVIIAANDHAVDGMVLARITHSLADGSENPFPATLTPHRPCDPPWLICDRSRGRMRRLTIRSNRRRSRLPSQ
jgi:hypothetical protein